MLFRWRSRPGRKSPEPRPRLDVSTQALPSGRRREVRRMRSAPRRLEPVDEGQRLAPAKPGEAGRRARAPGPPRARRGSGSAARVRDLDRLAPDGPRRRRDRPRVTAPRRPSSASSPRRSCPVERTGALVGDDLERATSPGWTAAPRAQQPPARRVDPAPSRSVITGSSMARQAAGPAAVASVAREPQRRLDEPRPRQPPVAPARGRPARPGRPGQRTRRARRRSGRSPRRTAPGART